MELIYFSDIQWKNNEKELFFNYMLNYIKKVLEKNENKYIILNGDLGDNGELFENIAYFLLENRNLLKNFKKKIIINFGNHDDVLKALKFKYLFKEFGIDNVLFITEPNLLELEGKKFLFVPGAHKISGPGTFAKNIFYEKRELLPSGYYLLYQNGQIERLDNKIVEEFIKSNIFPDYYKENYINQLKTLEEKMKRTNNENEKKNIEKEYNKLLEFSLKLTNLGELINNGLANLYYHVNTKELAEKYKNEEIFAIISHDPVKYNEKLGLVEGYKLEKDIDIPLRIKTKENYRTFNIKIPKGSYSKLELEYSLLPFKINSTLMKEVELLKDVNSFDLASRIVEYYSKKGYIKKEKINVADPYLSHIKVKFHLGGHIEGDYVIVNEKGEKALAKKEHNSLYGNIHTKRFPVLFKNREYNFYVPKFKLEDKITYELERLS